MNIHPDVYKQLNAWFTKRAAEEKETYFRESGLRSYVRLWLFLQLEEQRRRLANMQRVRKDQGKPPLLTRLLDHVQRLRDQPGRVWAKYIYAKASLTERGQIENAHLQKVLSILYRQSTGLAHGRRYGRATSMANAHKPWPGPHRPRATGGIMGPLDDRVRDEDLVRFLLEGTEWEKQPKKEEQEDNLGAVDVKTTSKGKKNARRSRH
jgi:hypothetical protein